MLCRIYQKNCSRIKCHFSEARYSKNYNKRLNWLRKIGIDNVGYLIYFDNIPTQERAIELEVYTIKSDTKARTFAVSGKIAEKFNMTWIITEHEFIK